jgi:hypothetical protein
MTRTPVAATVALMLGAATAPSSSAQSSTVITGGGFIPGGTVLYSSNFAQTPIGNFPSGLKYLRGNLEVVALDGVPMLRSSGPSEFMIQLAAPLPNDFTLEFDLQARNSNCCSGEELAFEGGPILNRSVGSAWVAWHHQYTGIIGGGQTLGSSTVTFPQDLQLELIGQRAQIQVMVSGTQFKLFTNGRRTYNIPDLVFRRTTSLRIFLGGVNDGDGAVYLARVTLSGGSGTPIAGTTPSSAPTQPAANPTLPPAPPGAPPPPQPGAPPPPPPPGTGGSPGTATSQQASTGTPTRAGVTGISVTLAPAGPVVTWSANPAATAYTVARWKIDDLNCCTNAPFLDPSTLPLRAPPWQDRPLPVSGTYVYEVTERSPAGRATGQTQFVYFKQAAPIATLPAGATPPVGPPSTPGSRGSVPVPPPPPPPPPSTPVIHPPSSPGAGTALAPPPGPPPRQVYFTGSPILTALSWVPPVVLRGITYTVQRWLEADPACCYAEVNGLTVAQWVDDGVQWPNAYVYRITAVYPDGSAGSVEQRWVPLAPVNPTGLINKSVTPGDVWLSWDPVSDATYFMVLGPGLPGNNFTTTNNYLIIQRLPAGTHTWTVGSYYNSLKTPAPVSTAASAFPKITVTIP